MMFEDSRKNLNDYQTNHLILLIGSNPLPNYVAAQLLLKPGGTIYLVHSGNRDGTRSSGTYQIAKRLCDMLMAKKESKAMTIETVQLIAVDEADSHKISMKIGAIIDAIPSKATIGLHYTGGTKAMAVHTYRAVESKCAKRAQPIFSYLDSRKLELQIEKAHEILSIPVQLLVDPSIEDLVALHGEQLKQRPPSEVAHLAEVATYLWQIYPDRNRRESWRTWLKQQIEPLKLEKAYYDNTKKKWINWKSERELRSKLLPWPPGEAGKCLSKQLTIDVHEGFTLGMAQDTLGMAECSDLCDWFYGHWLEDHVLSCLKKLRDVEKLPIGQVGKSLDTDEGVVTPGSDSHDFEVDVAALSGYQLFAFSCTTSWGKAILKQKLFEALIRGRQLGGDEARIALVTTATEREYDIAHALEQEVQTSWRPANMAKVFTPENSPKLQEALKSWIKRGV